jgi:hypothetical protein
MRERHRELGLATNPLEQLALGNAEGKMKKKKWFAPDKSFNDSGNPTFIFYCFKRRLD